jgi:hypothetical protein
MSQTMLGTLAAKLTADTRSFEQNIDNAARKTAAASSKMSGSMSKAATAVSGLNSAMGGALSSTNSLMGGLTKVGGLLTGGGVLGIGIAAATAAWGYYKSKTEEAQKAGEFFAKTSASLGNDLREVEIRLRGVGKEASVTEKALLGLARHKAVAEVMSDEKYQKQMKRLVDVGDEVQKLRGKMAEIDSAPRPASTGDLVDKERLKVARQLAEALNEEMRLEKQLRSPLETTNKIYAEKAKLIQNTADEAKKKSAAEKEKHKAESDKNKAEQAAATARAKVLSDQAQITKAIVDLQNKSATYSLDGAAAELAQIEILRKELTSRKNITKEQAASANAVLDELARQVKLKSSIKKADEEIERIAKANAKAEEAKTKALKDQADLLQKHVDLLEKSAQARSGASVGRAVIGQTGEGGFRGGASMLGATQLFNSSRMADVGDEFATSIDQAINGDLMGAIGGGIGALAGKALGGFTAAGAQIGSAIAGIAGQVAGAALQAVQQAMEFFSEQIGVLVENIAKPLMAGSQGAADAMDAFKRAVATGVAGVVVGFLGPLMTAIGAIAAALFAVTSILWVFSFPLIAIPMILGAALGAFGLLSAGILALARETESAAKFAAVLDYAFKKIVDATEPLFQSMLPIAYLFVVLSRVVAEAVGGFVQVEGAMKFVFNAMKTMAIATLHIANFFHWLLGLEGKEVEKAIGYLEKLTYANAMAKAEEIAAMEELAKTVKGLNQEFHNLPPGYKINLATYNALAGGGAPGGSEQGASIWDGWGGPESSSMYHKEGQTVIHTFNYYDSSGSTQGGLEATALAQTAIPVIGGRLMYSASVNG